MDEACHEALYAFFSPTGRLWKVCRSDLHEQMKPVRFRGTANSDMVVPQLMAYQEMLSITFYITLLSLLLLPCNASTSCPCGWKLANGNQHFTHRLFNDFGRFSRREDLSHHWLVNGYFRRSDNPKIRLNQQFGVENVQIDGSVLTLTQRGYSSADSARNKATSVAGIQSRTLEILHGSFRTVMKIEGATGGAVGSFFWYHVRNILVV